MFFLCFFLFEQCLCFYENIGVFFCLQNTVFILVWRTLVAFFVWKTFFYLEKFGVCFGEKAGGNEGLVVYDGEHSFAGKHWHMLLEKILGVLLLKNNVCMCMFAEEPICL